MSAQNLSILLLRLLGFLTALYGLVYLVAGVLASFGKVGLVYWQTFLITVILPPLLWILLGLALLFFARYLGRWLAKGL